MSNSDHHSGTNANSGNVISIIQDKKKFYLISMSEKNYIQELKYINIQIN